MIEYFRRRRLRKAFVDYVFVLGPSLMERYGSYDQYTVKQILATAETLKLNTRYIAYAVALFRREQSENTVKLLGVNQGFLDDLRSEIANSEFDGNINYSTKDVIELSKKAGWHGGPAPEWMANKVGQTSL